jgi:putative lipase involved disintegration of autophagic bodies
LVRIAIPKIDRFGIDRPALLCKILEKINDNYRVGSKFGVISALDSPGELDPLGTNQFPELETIFTNIITLREAARFQSVGVTTGTICNCKGNCNSNKCNCKKLGNNCGSRCHSGRQCQNKCQI